MSAIARSGVLERLTENKVPHMFFAETMSAKSTLHHDFQVVFGTLSAGLETFTAKSLVHVIKKGVICIYDVCLHDVAQVTR